MKAHSTFSSRISIWLHFIISMLGIPLWSRDWDSAVISEGPGSVPGWRTKIPYPKGTAKKKNLLIETHDLMKHHLPGFLYFFEQHWDSGWKPFSSNSNVCPSSGTVSVNFLFLLRMGCIFFLHEVLDILNIIMCLEMRFSCLPEICWHFM